MNAARGLALARVLMVALPMAIAGCAQQPAIDRPRLRAPDVPYEPSPMPVVREMLRLGEVKAGDVVYDLGCGDGRIVIAAARELGARGVCVDIDPRRIAEARANAREAGVAERIEFRNEDLFTTRIDDASAVMLFLWPNVNLSLRPRLLRELKAGTRVVSHWHDMGGWKPERTVRVPGDGRTSVVYLWTIPRPEDRPAFFEDLAPRRL